MPPQRENHDFPCYEWAHYRQSDPCLMQEQGQKGESDFIGTVFSFTDEITNSFRRYGHLVVDWPHKAESKSYFPPKGSDSFHSTLCLFPLVINSNACKCGAVSLSISKTLFIQLSWLWRSSESQFHAGAQPPPVQTAASLPKAWDLRWVVSEKLLKQWKTDIHDQTVMLCIWRNLQESLNEWVYGGKRTLSVRKACPTTTNPNL